MTSEIKSLSGLQKYLKTKTQRHFKINRSQVNRSQGKIVTLYKANKNMEVETFDFRLLYIDWLSEDKIDEIVDWLNKY